MTSRYRCDAHFFHGNIWTHNWLALNVRGFIAQLVEHRTGIARSRVQTPLKSWIFQASLRNCINCVHCDDHFTFSPYFCVFKYARTVKQKVWNEAENRERDCGRDAYGRVRLARFACVRLLRHALPSFFTDFEEKPTVLQSTTYVAFRIKLSLSLVTCLS